MGKGGRPKIPAPTPAAPTPEPLDEVTIQKQRSKRRQRLAAAGRAGTILTEGGFGVSDTGKSTLLGGALA